MNLIYVAVFLFIAALSAALALCKHETASIEREFLEYKLSTAKRIATANARTVTLLTAQQKAYTRLLEYRHHQQKVLAEELNDAYEAIETAKSSDKTFATWASTRIPPSVVVRLRKLPSERSASQSNKAVSVVTGSSD